MKAIRLICSLIGLSFGLHAADPALPRKQQDDAGTSKPNFIIIFTDDQGYNDLDCFPSST